MFGPNPCTGLGPLDYSVSYMEDFKRSIHGQKISLIQSCDALGSLMCQVSISVNAVL